MNQSNKDERLSAEDGHKGAGQGAPVLGRG
jgi:hypothetical protein